MKVQTIADQLFFVTVRIEGMKLLKNEDGTDGLSANSVGTGFFFLYNENNNNLLFLVTNKHVVDNSDYTRLFFTSRNDDESPNIGNIVYIDIPVDMWFGHEDDNIDIKILYMGIIIDRIEKEISKIFYRCITDNLIPSDNDIDSLDSIENITFIGYPNGIWDQKNYLPIVRKGVTASPISIDFNGDPKFIIDASVFGGSSGSPVFIWNNGVQHSRDGSMFIGRETFYFVGVLAAGYLCQNDIAVVSNPASLSDSRVVSRENIDLGIVFKSRTIIEAVKSFIHKNTSH